MNAVDAAIIRNIRREMGKRPIDPTRVDIQVVNGRVSLGGVVTHLRDQPDVDLKSEMDMIQKMIMRDPKVSDVAVNVRLREAEEQKKEEPDSRGRMRH
ncbi:MAG: hypothetical protein JO250_07045 [Armatimonadetes bacterium]|nr:hypothetical protein [Armatimonadota bacterium]